MSRGDAWRCLFQAAWRRGWPSMIWCWTGRWSPLWTVHTSFWKLQSDVVSTRQWPCCVTYTQHSVGSWASRLRLRVKELTSLSGRSSPLYLKSFLCASMHSAALPAWPTARPPARPPRVCQLLMMRMMEGIKEEMELTSGRALHGTPGDWGGSFEATCWMAVH